MNKYILTAMLSLQVTACAPALIGGAAFLAAAPEIDRQLNEHVFQGTPNKTISGDAARLAAQGDPEAQSMCGLYDIVAGWYDVLYFSPKAHKIFEEQGATDHCKRWALYESGELKRLIKERK